MAYKVILSPRAIRDLEQIVRYIAPRNADAAAKLGYELIAKTKALRDFPELGRKVPEFNDEKIRELILKNYRIIYRVVHENMSVEVSRFWHAARGTPAI
jgi:toxin ParE1/3/4